MNYQDLSKMTEFLLSAINEWIIEIIYSILVFIKLNHSLNWLWSVQWPFGLSSVLVTLQYFSSYAFRYVLGKFGLTQDVFIFSEGQVAHEEYVSFPGSENMGLIC